MNSLEIKDKRAILRKKAEDIINRCKVEVRDLTDDETKEIDDLKEQVKQLDEELKALNERLANLRFDDEDEDAEKTEDKQEIDKEDNKRSTMRKENFSLVRAIRAIANNQQLDAVTEAVIKAGQEEARKSGVSTQGQIQLPTSVESRAAITVAAEGEDVVATDLVDILTPLRAKNVLAKAGAKFMGGLVGDVQVPIMSANNVGWAGEVAQAADGAGTFSSVKLQPKRLTAYVDLSKQFLAQTSYDIESIVREDLINAINSKLEATILGSGDGKEGGATVVAPKGMFNGKTPTAISSFADLCGLEADVEDANVVGECKYVMSNKAKAALRGMTRGGDSSQNVFEGGEVDGTEALNTSSVAGSKYIYGDWSNLAIGNWASIDVTVDPYTRAAYGEVRLVVNAYFDAAILREGAFAYGDLA